MTITESARIAPLLKNGIAIGRNSLADCYSLGAALVRAPRRVGAITPSGRVLADAMAREIPFGGGPVVELGGGTGSITAGLLRGGVGARRLIVVEQDERLCARIRRRFPEIVVVSGDACDLPSLLDSIGITVAVTAVVSSLPVLAMRQSEQEKLLAATRSAMGGRGRLIQYTYGLRCPVPAALLARLGVTAQRRAWIWRNLPPAAVWRLESTSVGVQY